MSAFNGYALVPLMTSVALAILGFVCYRKNHSSRLHRIFFLLCLSVVAWPFALAVMLNLDQPEAVIWWSKAGHFTCTVAPALYFDFVITLLQLKRLRALLPFFYGYAVIAVIGMWSTDYYFRPHEVYQYAWGPYAQANWMATFDALFGCFVVVVSFGLLIQALRRAHRSGSRLEYNRLRYVTLALGLFSFALLDYIPKYGVPLPPIGSLFVLSFAGIVTYAIIRHQILDFSIAIRRTAIYSILAALLTASYLVVVLIMEKWFQGFFGYRSVVATSIVGFGIALGFVPLRNWVQGFVDRYFFKGSQAELAAQNEQLRREVQHTEKLKAVATLAAGMAHEIKNPLSAIKTFAEYLPQRYDDPEFREKFAKITAQEVDKMNTLVQRLLEFARPPQPQLQPVRLSGLVKEVLDLVQGTLIQKHIQVELAFAESDELLVDPGQMKQVFLNLLLNSVEAMERTGRITISTIQQNGHLKVVMNDTGPGIAKNDLQHVFDPFYTTKPGGTGLGLSVVHSIVREHGGRVAIQSEVGRGTTVQMYLPVNGHQTSIRPQTSDHRHQTTDISKSQ